MSAIKWKKALEVVTRFNGLKLECRNKENNGDIGIFKEKYTVIGCKYTLRQRPDGALNWDSGLRFKSMKECKVMAEIKYFPDVPEKVEIKVDSVEDREIIRKAIGVLDKYGFTITRKENLILVSEFDTSN
jgi:hypothetical protein